MPNWTKNIFYGIGGLIIAGGFLLGEIYFFRAFVPYSDVALVFLLLIFLWVFEWAPWNN